VLCWLIEVSVGDGWKPKRGTPRLTVQRVPQATDRHQNSLYKEASKMSERPAEVHDRVFGKL
jgi:hypothetical protein